MKFPVYLHVAGISIHAHLFFELLAYAVAYQVYKLLRVSQGDALDDGRRWWIIAAAAVGALVGGRVLDLFRCVHAARRCSGRRSSK